QTPLDDEAQAPEPRNDDRDKQALRRLQDAAAARSAELAQPDGVLASRRWLEQLLGAAHGHGDPWPGPLSGWRRAELVPVLTPLLSGNARGSGLAAGTFASSATSWGGSSAGRASRSQCEGREFDPPPLRHFFFRSPSGFPGKTPPPAGFFVFRHRLRRQRKGKS